MQVLAPEEEEFPFRRPARFRNLENVGQALRIDPTALRNLYLERFRAHCEGLKNEVRGMQADYHPVSTAKPPDRVLLDYLGARAGQGRGR